METDMVTLTGAFLRHFKALRGDYKKRAKKAFSYKITTFPSCGKNMAWR
jgi:hypothetical protein